MDTLLLIMALGGLYWFWSDSLKSRETALLVCTRACRQSDVQLLDQTVAVLKLGLGRSRSGSVSIRRHYGFEFSVDGAMRRQGRAVLLGRAVEYVELDLPDGLTIVDDPKAPEHVLH